MLVARHSLGWNSQFQDEKFGAAVKQALEEARWWWWLLFVVLLVVVVVGGGGGTAAVGRKRLGDLCRCVCLSKIPSLSRFEPGTVRKRSILNCPSFSSWWLQFFWYVHRYLGKIPILTKIFQRGWNHQQCPSFCSFLRRFFLIFHFWYV